MKRNEDDLKDLRDNIRPTNIIEIPEGEEREAENMFEDIITEKLP